jgi:hypothetical protein
MTPTHPLYLNQVRVRPKENKPRVLPGAFAVLLGVVLAVAFVPPLGLLICLGLSVYAWKGPRETIEAFTVLALLLLLGNDYTSSMGRWLVLFSGFGRTMWDSVVLGRPTPAILRPLVLFAVTVSVFAILVSYVPAVSLLKVTTFTMGIATIMSGLYRTPHLRVYWFSWFLTFGSFLLFASLPLYGFAYGYRDNGSGFQGILSHPQAFGIVAAPITAFLTGMLLFQNNFSPVVVLGVAMGWAGVFTSQARTALLATLGSLAICLAIGFFRGSEWRGTIVRTVSSGRFMFVVLAALTATVWQWSAIRQGTVEFLLKDDAEESVMASLQSSRGALVQRSIDNFIEHPLIGIGFGVPSDRALLRVKEGPLGIPLGASAEKGFMPSAVLEETGLVGGVLVLLFLAMLVAPVLKRGGMFALWVMLACLAINGGEMIFFAIGAGDCVLLWLLMGFCHFYEDPSLQPARTKVLRPLVRPWLQQATG